MLNWLQIQGLMHEIWKIANHEDPCNSPIHGWETLSNQNLGTGDDALAPKLRAPFRCSRSEGILELKRFLEGLNTYIHPENLANDKSQSGFRPAIRRPGNTESSSSSSSSSGLEGYQNLSSSNNEQPRKKNRSKEKFEFDENNAQIFRLQLVDSHLRSRLYFSDYNNAFIYSVVAISSFILHQFLTLSENSGVLINGSVIPILLGFLAVFKVFVVIGRLSFERSASKRTEKQLSVIFGGLGFVLGFSILFVIAPSVFDFKFDSIDGFGKVLIAILAGCLAGFLFMPAAKIARSFWLGTDQLRWNLSIISCGWFARLLLYVNFIIGMFTSLLWIKPVAAIFVNSFGSKGVNSSERIGASEKLVGNLGMLQSDFDKFRLWCLLAFGLSQFVTLRPNLQMYLNEAVLSWYQRLHSSKVPDLDFSRAKIFLHNYYLCLVVLQFFAPSALVLLFLGLSQIEEVHQALYFIDPDFYMSHNGFHRNPI
ncbi:Transmembrane protein 161A/B [Macleaya cordata]|uniref:Transmembrane protein 161A/B n=1 Tax=Macleaya cordata TaxID=56857 RepID=A0A200QUI4_MACCD|nr:Transmembrane protein 161A/B [Macleaya cordata]